MFVAAGMGLVGIASSTVQLAKALFAISCAGLVVLLVTGAAARRRWTLR